MAAWLDKALLMPIISNCAKHDAPGHHGQHQAGVKPELGLGVVICSEEAEKHV